MVVLYQLGGGQEAPPVPACHPEDDRAPRALGHRRFLWKVPADHLQDVVSPVTVGSLTHPFGPILFGVIQMTSAPRFFARSSFSCVLAGAIAGLAPIGFARPSAVARPLALLLVWIDS